MSLFSLFQCLFSIQVCLASQVVTLASHWHSALPSVGGCFAQSFSKFSLLGSQRLNSSSQPKMCRQVLRLFGHQRPHRAPLKWHEWHKFHRPNFAQALLPESFKAAKWAWVLPSSHRLGDFYCRTAWISVAITFISMVRTFRSIVKHTKHHETNASREPLQSQAPAALEALGLSLWKQNHVLWHLSDT